MRFLLLRSVRCGAVVALSGLVVGANEVQYCVMCMYGTKCATLFDNLSNCPGQKSAKFSGGENPGNIYTSVIHVFNPKGHQTLLYFLFLGKGRVSRDYFTACLV